MIIEATADVSRRLNNVVGIIHAAKVPAISEAYYDQRGVAISDCH